MRFIHIFFDSLLRNLIWQRHVSWAKPEGKDLRLYYTQRYASTMVFLSLMLSGEITVFFNSSNRMTQMRDALESGSHSKLKYWIGIVMMLSIVVTVVGIVATFTVWGMVLAISDKNAHCLLRSSIGLYVIGLPPRYVVAALYLFLMWVILWMAELIAGKGESECECECECVRWMYYPSVNTILSQHGIPTHSIMLIISKHPSAIFNIYIQDH